MAGTRIRGNAGSGRRGGALARRLASTAGLAAGLAAALVLADDAQARERSLSFKQMHTGETVTVTYRRGDRYLAEGLRRVNHILRDWRTDEVTEIDPELLDIIWEVKRETGSSAPVHVLSGYRAPETNAALRARGRGVAKKSQHTVGRALDFYLPDVPLSKLRETALKFQRGGVGFYPSSGSPFVHLDTGRVRHWPRLPRQQLTSLFPDGKTLHIPTDGKPLPGYEQAKAEAEDGAPRTAVATTTEPDRERVAVARDDPSLPVRGGTTAASADGGGGLLAGLFGGPATEDEAPAESPAPAPAEVAAAPTSSEPDSPAPLPPTRPTAAEDDDEGPMIAALPEPPLPAPRPEGPGAPADGEAADVPVPAERPIRTASTGGEPGGSDRASLSTGAIEALTALAPNRRIEDRLPFADTFVDAGDAARSRAELVAPDQRPAALAPLVAPDSGLGDAAFVRLHRPAPARPSGLMAPAAVVLENSFAYAPAWPVMRNVFRGPAVAPVATRSYELADQAPRDGRLADLTRR